MNSFLQNASKPGGPADQDNKDASQTTPNEASTAPETKPEEKPAEGLSSTLNEVFAAPAPVGGLKRPAKESEAAAEEVIPIVAAYKHRDVNHFKVGPFEFRKHILQLHTEEAHEAFLRLYAGLPPRDQSAIVEYDYEAAARVERPVSSVTRNGLSTADIKDPKQVQ